MVFTHFLPSRALVSKIINYMKIKLPNAREIMAEFISRYPLIPVSFYKE